MNEIFEDDYIDFTDKSVKKLVKTIHESHKMSEWENIIITMIDTPRFGRVRKCLLCDATQAETVAGNHIDYELTIPCIENYEETN